MVPVPILNSFDVILMYSLITELISALYTIPWDRH